MDKETKYTVENLSGNTYQILDIEYSYYDGVTGVNVLFQGSLSDCESWIRLKENESIDF